MFRFTLIKSSTMLKSVFFSILFFSAGFCLAQTPFNPETESDFVKATYAKGNLPTQLSQHLTYPEQAAINGTQGDVIFILKIDKSGKLVSVESKERVSDNLTNPAEEAIAKLTNSWTPSKIHGEPVDREYLLVFSYRILYNSLPLDYHAMAKKFEEKDKLDKAVRTYNQAIEENPYEPNYYTFRAKYKKELGDEEGAKEDLLMAEKINMEVLAVVEIGRTQSIR